MGFIRTSIATPLSLSNASESLLHTQPHVRVFLSSTHTLGSGTLHITSKRVLWLPDDAQSTGSGYGIDFPQLLMHALSRDTAYFPHPAIYCQLEHDDDKDDRDDEEGEEEEEMDAADGDGASEAEAGGDELTRAAEVWLVPDDDAALNTLYAKLSDGAELNPDEEREGEGDFFDAASLQCAPGVNIQSLLAGDAPTGVEHAGEEDEEDEEDEDEDDEDDEDDEVEGNATADVQLAVTGHAIRSTAAHENAAAALEPDAMDDDVNVEHREGEVIFKR